jgi:hypothetical protein
VSRVLVSRSRVSVGAFVPSLASSCELIASQIAFRDRVLGIVTKEVLQKLYGILPLG